ncbi:MAG TPA: 2-phosphosulfolactate phosphatase [Bacteroidia bacterium]|nr:2-phosphosulfolactate phosphatase [Bacteroidia bacterium]
MSQKAHIDVCFSPFLYPVYEKEEQIVVVIDILRATSAICTAFQYGVDKMIPVATVEEAAAYKELGFLVGAERNAVAIEGFDFGNSPYSYMTEKIKGQTVVITTTNGTQAIEAAKNAYAVVIGSFLNITTLCEWLVKENKSILLLCSGWKNKFNLEDTLFAGAVTEILSKHESFKLLDGALATKYLYQQAHQNPYKFLNYSSHKERLAAMGLKDDIKYCLTLDQTHVIPILKDKYLVLK